MIAKQFPVTHKRKGEETDFRKKLFYNVKKHTIRANYELWKYRIDQINSGKAILSVRQWEGKPYRSKQIELFNQSKVGIQKLDWTALGWFIDDMDSDLNTKTLAKNDGLSPQDFADWFKKYPKETMAIIQLSKLRY
jgi:hypothetical protein